MNITDIKVRPVTDNDKLKAYVTVTFDKELVIHNIKVISSDNSLFIAMPSRKTNLGEYKDVVHPISQDFRERLTKEVLDAYQKETATVV